MTDPRAYLIPRQVTARFEFFPGFGLAELTAVAAAILGGVLLAALAGRFGVPLPLRAVLLLLPPAAAWQAVQGGPHSLLAALLRMRVYRSRPQRLLYRAGAAGVHAPPPLTSSGETSRGRPPGLLRWLAFLPFGRRASRPPEPALSPAVQAWLPVRDVTGGVLLRRDGHLVAAVRVMPLNLGLRSLAEQQRIIAGVHEAINALQHPAQILSLARPLDLDAYVRGLEARLRELDSARQRLLRPYIRHVSGLVAGGEALERRHYVLLPQPPGRSAREELQQRAFELAERLRRADLDAQVLDDAELLDLLHAWSHPAQAAFERPPLGPPAITTFLEGRAP